MSVTYSFLDVVCSIVGPGGNLILSESGLADEGITIEMEEDKTSMVGGATRGGMHSLHAGNRGRVVVRLLKNSPLNAALMNMYRFQSTSSAYTGQNTISLSNPIWGDDHTCQDCAFVRLPPNNNGKDGGTMEWAFNSLDIDSQLGDGTLQL